MQQQNCWHKSKEKGKLQIGGYNLTHAIAIGTNLPMASPTVSPALAAALPDLVGGWQTAGRLGVLLPSTAVLPKWLPMKHSASIRSHFVLKELTSTKAQTSIRLGCQFSPWSFQNLECHYGFLAALDAFKLQKLSVLKMH